MAENDAQQIPTTEQSQAYHTETPPDPLHIAISDAEQSVTATADDVNAAKERAAFETYVESTGGEVPENFADSNAWFASLKEAQKNYTQGQQEISQLRQQIAAVPTPQPVVTGEPDNTVVSDELRIEVNQPTADPEPEGGLFGTAVSEDDWSQWQYEVATTGDLLAQTKQEIMNKTGLNAGMVDDFLNAQKSRMREAKGKAADTVGGTEVLNSMFKWATTSLSQVEQYSINAGLADAGMQDITLMGLKAKYDMAMNAKPTANEPARNIVAEPMASTAPAFKPYFTKREFTADRSNPRFGIEPEFRHAVESRMMLTDFNHIPE
jgi:hypothetical protein